LVPAFSISLHLNDDPITTIRHMESQVWLQILVVIAGYVLLVALRYDWKTILYVFGIGCLLSFMRVLAVHQRDPAAKHPGARL
jgi:hypothetical protein